MSLTRVPPTPALPHPGEPFVVYAIWGELDAGSGSPVEVPVASRSEGYLHWTVVKFSAANIPGGALSEFAVGGELAATLATVYPEELPICLTLALVDRTWRFDYLGSAADFGNIWQIPGEVQPNAPTPLLPEELNRGAEDMLRESLGIPPGEPIPEPAGRLGPDEQPDEPYRFDPTRHMDLAKADAAPPLPPPRPPGPDPAPGAQEFFAPPYSPPQDKRHGAYGDESVPFTH